MCPLKLTEAIYSPQLLLWPFHAVVLCSVKTVLAPQKHEQTHQKGSTVKFHFKISLEQ